MCLGTQVGRFVLFMRYRYSQTKKTSVNRVWCCCITRFPVLQKRPKNVCLSVFVWFYDFVTVFKIRLFSEKKTTHPRVPQTAWQPKRGGFVMNILKFNFLEEKPRTAAQNTISSHWWENAPTQYFWVFTGRDENNYLQTLRRVQMIFSSKCACRTHYL